MPFEKGRPGSVQTKTEESLYDADLVRRFNLGDEKAFIEIMNRHREKLFTIALVLLRNRGDAEEIAQDTFIRAHRNLAKFRGESSLATWLTRITINLSKNRYWYFFRRRRHLLYSIDAPFSEENNLTFADIVASDANDPEQEASLSEFSTIIVACMEKLGARHKEVLTLRNIFNRSYEDIAQALGISVGTVKSRIARARGLLYQSMIAMCPELIDAQGTRNLMLHNRSRMAV